MAQDEHVSYYIRAHGAKLAWFHLHDWLVLLLLVLLEVILNTISPFYRFVGKEMMTDLKYPLKPNTVPVWSVPLYAVLLPISVFTIYYFRRRNAYDLHHATLGLLYAVLITGVLTDAIKDGVGRPRPDFFWRCFPDGIEFYDELGDVICHGEESVIKEGHKSFPSGHTAWSFAGLGFLSMYLSGKIRIYDQKGHIAKLCIVVTPLLAAALVGVSRVDDYWHHWQDVFTGGLLGFVVAMFCYHQFFPAPYHHKGWWPHAYLQARKEAEELEEEQRRSCSAHGSNVAADGPVLVPDSLHQQTNGTSRNDLHIPVFIPSSSSSELQNRSEDRGSLLDLSNRSHDRCFSDQRRSRSKDPDSLV